MTFRILLFLAWRNLWRNKRRTTITLVTISFGFALAVLSIGIGDGGHNNMIRNGTRMGEGQLTIQPKGYLASPGNHLYLADGMKLLELPAFQRIPGKVAPRVFLQVLISTAHNSMGGGMQGVRLEDDPLREFLEPKLTAGKWPLSEDKTGVVIGEKMARRLKAKIGSKVVVMAGGESGKVESRLARVRGVFRTGIDGVDSFTMVGGLTLARALLPGNGELDLSQAITRLAIFLDAPDDAPIWKEVLASGVKHPEAVVLDWQQMMPDLVNFIVLDDGGNYVWLTIVWIVVVFGIINTILMSVLERTREFGLVRALGLRAKHLLALVVVESVLLGVVSLVTGWMLGGMVHAYFAIYGLDLSAMSQESLTVGTTVMDPIMKSELSISRMIQLSGVMFLTTVASGLYPAFRASRVTPLAALAT